MSVIVDYLHRELQNQLFSEGLMTATLDEGYVHSLHITNSTGDFEVTWHRDSADEVKAAKAAFEQALKDKMLVYRTDRHGNKAEKLTRWDPDAEKIVATRQFVGG